MLLAVAIPASADRPDVPPPNQRPTFNLQEHQEGEPGAGWKTPGIYDGCKGSFETNVPGLATIANSAGTLLCGGMAGGAGAVEALGRGAYNVGSWGKSKFWPDPIGNFTKAVLEGNTQAFSALMTFWVSVPLGSLGVQGGTTGEYLGAAGRGEEP